MRGAGTAGSTGLPAMFELLEIILRMLQVQDQMSVSKSLRTSDTPTLNTPARCAVPDPREHPKRGSYNSGLQYSDGVDSGRNHKVDLFLASYFIKRNTVPNHTTPTPKQGPIPEGSDTKLLGESWVPLKRLLKRGYRCRYR